MVNVFGLIRKSWAKRFVIRAGIILSLTLLSLWPPSRLNTETPAVFAAALPTLDGVGLKQPQANEPPYHKIIVKMRDQLTESCVPTGHASLDATMAYWDVQDITPLFDANSGNAALKQELGLSRMYVLTLPSSGNLQDALAAFSADPAIEYAEPDYVGYGAGIPNDQWFDYQWHLHNTGQSGGDPDADVDAPEAWDISLGITSTILAIVDTGVDLDHPDLAGKIVSGQGFVTYTTSPQDDHGHGTHVAGIAAAITDNSIGAAGICPGCSIMPLKALNNNNQGYYSWWISATVYAVDNGAHVINMSLGGVNDSQALHDAVRYAYSADVPIVAAMMNDGDATLYYPAAFTETIAVGATDRYDDRSTFSNYGNHLDLVAPGTDILSTAWDDVYAIWDGTSAATPQVAGTLGLIHAVHPGYTIEELRAILRTTGDDQVGPPNEDKAGWDKYFGAGRLNVARAVQHVVPPSEASVNGPAEGIISVAHTFSATISPLTVAQPITYAWQATGQAPDTHTGGLSDTLTFAWDTPGAKVITVTVVNFGGAVSATHAITITPPPPVTDLTVCQGGGCDYDTIQAAVDAVDEGGIVRVATGVYTGVNSYESLAQVVYVSKTITICGGYASTFVEPPDPDANPTTVDAQGGGRGLYVSGDVSPTIKGLRITGGDADGLGGGVGGGDVGGGMFVIDARAIISDNRIFGNTARWGGGLYLRESATTLAGNTISANNAEKDGGGLYLRSSNATLVGNDVVSNTSGEWGGGLHLYESDATLVGNDVVSNTANKDGGGLYLWKSDATLDGNVVVSNLATDEGGGLYLVNSDATLVNDVIADNQADVAGSGLYVRASSPLLLHATIARNTGGDGSGVYVSGDAGVVLTNTILVHHTVGITVASGSTATLVATLWGGGDWANATDWDGVGAISSAHERWGDPAFVAPDAGDYHIGAGSAALNAGVDVGTIALCTHDLDGDPRPIGAGYDVGADEFPTSLTASLAATQQASDSVVQAGAQLTYTLRVTNTGDVYVHAAITDALPSHVSPGGVRTWTPAIAPGDSWTEMVTVTVEETYTGLLTNEVQITSAEGASDANTSVVIVVEAVTTVGPAENETIVISGGDGMTITVDIPTGAVTEPTQLAYAAVPTVTGAPPDFSFAGRAFRLDAYRDGVLAPGLAFEIPITVTIHYTEGDVAGLDENTLELRYRDGDDWLGDGITVVQRDTANHRLVTQVEHLSEFATFAKVQQQQQSGHVIYLPLVQRH